MWKKFMALIFAVVLCFGMTVTVIADYNYDNTVYVEITAESGAPEFEVNELIGEECYNNYELAMITNEYIGMNLGSADILYSREFWFELQEGYAVPASGMQITFTDENISTDKSYMMIGIYFEEPANENEMSELVAQNMPISVSNGQISGTINLAGVDDLFYMEIGSSAGSDSGEAQPENTPNSGGTSGEAQPESDASASVSVSTEPVEIAFELADGTAMNWITSKGNTNISISGSQTNIPSGAEFSATRLFDGEEAIRAANAVINAKGNVKYEIYDFSLTSAEGQAITKFNGHVDVSLVIPNGFSTEDGNVISVYYVGPNKLEKCNSVVDGNFITFGTSHFSTFVIVEETAVSAASSPVANGVTSPKTGETNTALYISVLGLMALGMSVCVIGKTKYNK